MIEVRFLGRPRRLFHGWLIVIAGFIAQTLSIGLGFLGFGTFLIPLEREFGWSKTTLSAARSFIQVQNGLMGPLEGVLIEKFGPRLTMGVGMFIFGLGLLLLGFIQSLWAYYAVFIVIALGISLGGFLVITTAINHWFRRRRTLALSLATMGVGFGGVSMVPLLVWAQDAFGWRGAAIAAGLFVWATGIPASLLMRHPPERYGVLPDGDPPPSPGVQQPTPVTVRGAHHGGLIDFTLGEAMRTQAFWLMGLGHGIHALLVTAAATHHFAHMEQGMGLARSSAAIVVTVLSTVNVFSRLVGGVLGDRFDKRHVAVLGMAGMSASLVILAFGNSLGMAMAYAVVFGFSWAVGGGVMVSSLRGDYFGRASFAKIAGMSSLLIMPGPIIGPLIAGIMADIQGDYQMAFIILAGVGGLGCLTFMRTRPPAPPARLRGSPTPQARDGPQS